METEVVIEEDRTTERLYQTKLLLDVIGSSLAVWFFFDIINRGRLSYYLNWYFMNLTRKYRAQREQEIAYRRSLGRVLFEADRIVRESTNG